MHVIIMIIIMIIMMITICTHPVNPVAPYTMKANGRDVLSVVFPSLAGDADDMMLMNRGGDSGWDLVVW